MTEATLAWSNGTRIRSNILWFNELRATLLQHQLKYALISNIE